MKLTRIYPKLEKFISLGKSVLVLGPRGSGKTFFLEKLVNQKENKMKVNLLEATTFSKYLKNPSLLFDEVMFKINQLDKKNKAFLYCFVDEVQRIPQLLNEVHRVTDHTKQAVFILTGSSARKLRTSDANLLAGRAISFSFYPLSIFEIPNYDQNKIKKILQYGSLPQAYTENTDEVRTSYLNSYSATYLEEEIRRESGIRNLQSFAQFLELAAAENGNPINYSKIARATHVHTNTLKEYFQILEDTLIVKRIPAWSQKIRTQLQKAPKYYFFDNGVLNSLTGNLLSELKTSSYRYGSLFENLVVNEIMKEIDSKQLPIKMSHYRDANQKEIDLILQKNMRSNPVAIEIKSSTMPEINSSHRIRTFKEEFVNAKTMIICNCERPFEKDNLEYWPIREGITKALELAMI